MAGRVGRSERFSGQGKLHRDRQDKEYGILYNILEGACGQDIERGYQTIWNKRLWIPGGYYYL